MSRTLTAYIEYDPETQLYVGLIPGLPGAHSQAESLDTLQQNLKEVIRLCLEENQDFLKSWPRFVGVQQIEVA